MTDEKPSPYIEGAYVQSYSNGAATTKTPLNPRELATRATAQLALEYMTKNFRENAPYQIVDQARGMNNPWAVWSCPVYVIVGNNGMDENAGLLYNECVVQTPLPGSNVLAELRFRSSIPVVGE